MKRALITGIIYLSALNLFLYPSLAHAYLDPGTGSYIFQVLIAVVIGGLFAIKMFWQKIKNFFGNLFSSKQER